MHTFFALLLPLLLLVPLRLHFSLFSFPPQTYEEKKKNPRRIPSFLGPDWECGVGGHGQLSNTMALLLYLVACY
jgi:hypothetical protein